MGQRCGVQEDQAGGRKAFRWVEYLVGGVTARTAADLPGVDKDTAAWFYHKVRVAIERNIREQAPFVGEVGVDASYFGGRRKGKRGRGAKGKVPVFGILKRAGRVYTVPIPNLKTDPLIPIIREKVVPDSIVYTDGFKSYDVLNVSEFKHEGVDHDKELVERQGKHINGLENFWNQAKGVLRKNNGVPKQNFHLFVKECEFRFNYGSPSQQLDTLKRWLKQEGIA
ncbi:MAG: IS1595 family transposase [Meiothermus sp.]|uniref:IS1595 family transposase n=1 Tax=Meiothermus sp. TaxID=1955249 RepID=UPI0025F479B5|nr:IS1595 family transposase [Meiothermus sp.]MCS7068876.1 IS1595 family transposase [Meiothermus sp.]